MCGNRRSTAAWRGPARNLFRPSAEHEFSVNPFDGEKSNGVDRIVGGWMRVSSVRTRVQAPAAALANTWMDTVLQQNDVDILVTGMLYSGNVGAAGIPALTIPNGLDANGRPQGIILSGPYLSDPQRIAHGDALEQALNGWVEPDLDATIAEIDAVTGK